jgi:pyridoxal phosphate enzyme (YggS family)
MPEIPRNFRNLNNALSACAEQSGHSVRLLAVSKTQPVEAIRACHQLGQRAFGENYVQEAVAKIQALQELDIEWHLIGPLQSNKCKTVAEHFDWVQSVDREKIIPALNQYRPAHLPPLNVLIQVNVDDEASKSGCAVAEVETLAQLVATQPKLLLRGLMAIPDPNQGDHGRAFAAMQNLFHTLQARFAGVDTLSMGMSDDFPSAIAHGANLVRIGSALFGARPEKPEAP